MFGYGENLTNCNLSIYLLRKFPLMYYKYYSFNKFILHTSRKRFRELNI